MLPKHIVSLDQHGRPRARYVRTMGNLAESDYDAIVVANHGGIAAALRESGLIAADSTLRVLGTEVSLDGVGRVDVLMAEVDEAADEFRRLVVFEDKLLKNPESRRKVLGQILDYAAALETADVDDLISSCSIEDDWADDARDLIAQSMQRGEFLLVICGDEPHPRMVTLTRRFAQMANADPLCLYQLCALSLAIYEHEAERILVPHVVSSVAEPERALTIQVKDSAGNPVKASVVRDEVSTTRNKGPVRTEEEFFQDLSDVYHESDVAAAREVLLHLERAGITGLEVTHTPGGRPRVSLRDSVIGPIKILQLAGKRPAFVDSFHTALKKLQDHEAGQRGVMDFRQFLLSFEGAQRMPSDRVRAPVREVAVEKNKLVERLKDLVVALSRR